MNRKLELERIYENTDESIKQIIMPMLDDVVYLESKLDELRKLPSIAVNPKNPQQQKATAAAKQYKEYLQQYSNCIKILCSVLNKNTTEEDSPLDAWLKARASNG